MHHATEKTLVLIKPDAHQNGKASNIWALYMYRGLNMVQRRELDPTKESTKELLEAHYAEHLGRSYYDNLINFMTSGPITALVFEGEGVIERVRMLHGATDPAKAELGTIRAMFGTNVTKNAVHASDSVESAEREIAIWFTQE